MFNEDDTSSAIYMQFINVLRKEKLSISLFVLMIGWNVWCCVGIYSWLSLCHPEGSFYSLHAAIQLS